MDNALVTYLIILLIAGMIGQIASTYKARQRFIHETDQRLATVSHTVAAMVKPRIEEADNRDRGGRKATMVELFPGLHHEDLVWLKACGGYAEYEIGDGVEEK